jgi:drug/metabolite transporter (DMT)-like permease
MWKAKLAKIPNDADAILFVGLAAIWGTAYLAIDVGLQSAPPVTLAALRYDVAGAVLVVAAIAGPIRRGGQWRPRSAAEWKLVAEGGLLVVGLHFALLFVGQQYVSGGVASVVMSLTPVLTPLFALTLLSDERLDSRESVGVLLGLLGVAIVARPTPGDGSGSGARIAIGVALLFLSAASLALGSVLTRRHQTGMSVVPTQAWMMGLGALVLDALVIALPGESFARVEPSVELFAALAYLSVVASVGGFVAYFHLLDRFGPNEATLVSYVVPMFAALSQWVALGEGISTTTAVGFGVILVGFATVKWRAVRRTVTPTPDRVTAVSATSSDNTIVVGGNAYYRAAD